MEVETETEFQVGDVIVQIGHYSIGEITGKSGGLYFIKWKIGGESMMWDRGVDREFVLLERKSKLNG